MHGPAFWNQNILIKGFQKKGRATIQDSGYKKHIVAAAEKKLRSLSRCLPRSKSVSQL